jgi:hypothetical protein
MSSGAKLKRFNAAAKSLRPGKGKGNRGYIWQERRKRDKLSKNPQVRIFLFSWLREN